MHALTLKQYVLKRNGLALGAKGSLQNMLYRSFGSGTFAGFWKYWNPIWSYYLSKYFFFPLSRLLPKAMAVVLTFLVSGLLHDMAIMAVHQSVKFVITPWFLILGVAVVTLDLLGVDYSKQKRIIRAIINFSIIVACYFISLIIKEGLAVYN